MSELSFDTILTETESSIDRQWRDMEFCYAVMEQHREMEQFVNECLIKASGNKKAINEMYIVINESGITDKIKNFFTKIKNFFKKIFDKAIASFNGFVSEGKKYCEKYAYIITKCKWQCGDISDVKDHFTGIARIDDVIKNSETAIYASNTKYLQGSDVPLDSSHYINLDTFNSADTIERAEIPAEDKIDDIKTEAFNKFISDPNSYWNTVENFKNSTIADSNGIVDVNATFKAWFDGSEDTTSWSSDEVEKNFQTIINCVYAGESYVNKLNKISNTVSNKMEEVQKNMEDYYKAQKDKIANAISGKAGDNAAASNGVTAKWADLIKGKQQDGNGKYTVSINGHNYTGNESEIKSAAASNGVKIESTFLFEDGMKIGSSNDSSSDKDNARSDLNGRGVNQVKNAGEQNEKLSKAQATSMKIQNVNNTDMSSKTDEKEKSSLEEKANKILEIDIRNKQTRINADINISSSIARAVLNSFTGDRGIFNDFYNIIKAHVQWYLSNPGSEKKSENVSTSIRNLNLNAGDSVKHTTK
jgi:hypothetical protein